MPGNAKVNYRLEGYEPPPVWETEEKVEEEEEDGGHGRMAIVRATNVSGHTLWYEGHSVGSPCDVLSIQVIDGESREQLSRITVGHENRHPMRPFTHGEDFVFQVYVDENAKLLKAGLIFKSYWLGEPDTPVFSDELDEKSVREP